MADESTAVPEPGGTAAAGGPSPLSAAQRAGVTQCYNRGMRALEGKPPDLDYAIEMFATCVRVDSGNTVFIQALLGAARQKVGARKGGGLAALWGGGSGKGGLRRYASKGRWHDLIDHGVDVIKSNPYDHGSLLAMAEAVGALLFYDAQRHYLKAALDVAPKDVDVNRACAEFLASHGDFDQAVACWVRIRDTKGLADEADREISRLQVEKTIAAGRGLVGRYTPDTDGAGSGDQVADRVEALRRQVREHPTVIDPYLDLADLLEREVSVDEAEEVLLAALAASGNDLKIQEHLEDRQLRWARRRVILAEQRLQENDTPEARAALENLKNSQLRRDIEIYAARAARYPEVVIWRYKLALKLKAAGNFTEAIREFQEVLRDPRRKGAVSLELGECFQKIRQFDLALRNYVAAVDLLTDREIDLRKRALYRAGVLASGLGDVDLARKYFAQLATLDFGYRDVVARLDKLGPLNDNWTAREPPRDPGGKS